MSKKVVMFTTPTCSSCNFIKPMISSKGLDIEIVDATEDPLRASKHNVGAVPTFVVEDENGEHVNTVAIGKEEGIKFVNEFERFA